MAYDGLFYPHFNGLVEGIFHKRTHDLHGKIVKVSSEAFPQQTSHGWWWWNGLMMKWSTIEIHWTFVSSHGWWWNRNILLNGSDMKWPCDHARQPSAECCAISAAANPCLSQVEVWSPCVYKIMIIITIINHVTMISMEIYGYILHPYHIYIYVCVCVCVHISNMCVHMHIDTYRSADICIAVSWWMIHWFDLVAVVIFMHPVI